MSLVEPQTRLFTRDEYYAMGETGMFDGQRVELIEGQIVQMAPQKNDHSVALGLVSRLMGRVFPENTHWIRVQQPLHLSPRSEPEPDVAVVIGEPRDYKEHPSAAILIVEISESSLLFDRSVKARVYAKAGIADYWIVNLIDRCVEIHRDPRRDSTGHWSYFHSSVITPDQRISPLAAPQASVLVSDLIP